MCLCATHTKTGLTGLVNQKTGPWTQRALARRIAGSLDMYPTFPNPAPRRRRTSSAAPRPLLRMSKLGAALDVFSPAFDPELALASPALSEQLGALFPRAQPLNNVSECRRLLPPSATDAVQTEHHLRAGSSHALAPKVVAPEARPGVDTRTAGAPSTAAAAEAGRQKLSAQWRAQFEEGPLSILSKLQRRRVRVVTRHEGGLRGWCEGQLLLCDRHFDMLLSDAIEHFVSPLDRQWQQRRSDQLLLRGDGVVSVCDLQSVAARDDRAAFGALILGLDEN